MKSSGSMKTGVWILALLLCLHVPLSAGEDGDEGGDSATAERAEAVGSKERAGAVSPQPPAAFQPPSVHNVRYEEDWYQPAGSRNSLKYIPLGGSGTAFLSLGGQVRMRGEFWDDFGFAGGGARDDAFGLLRVRLHSNLYLGSRLRFHLEGRSALSSGRGLPGGNRPIDIDRVDLLNALVDVKAPVGEGSFTLRFGRQEMQLGKQRLVSPLDWANTRRTFDSLRGILEVGGWRLDAFYSRLVRVRKYDFNTNDSGIDLFGAYLAGALGKSGLNADFYWLGLDRVGNTFGGVGGDEQRQSVGARLGGRIGAGRFDFDAEGTLQFGDHAGRDIRAWMFSAEVGYLLPSRWTPRFFAGFDYASGDDDPADGRVGTFNQLFPLAHAYLGFADVTSRQNNVDLHAGVAFKPAPRITVRTDLHQLWRANENDALYNAGGAVVREGGPGTPKEVGTEIDLTAKYKLRKGWAATGGYTRVFAGDFIRATGPDKDIDFAHLGIQYTF